MEPLTFEQSKNLLNYILRLSEPERLALEQLVECVNGSKPRFNSTEKEKQVALMLQENLSCEAGQDSIVQAVIEPVKRHYEYEEYYSDPKNLAEYKKSLGLE